MTERVERVSLEGRTVRVAVRVPLPVGARLLAAAAALRVFERYPVFDRLVVEGAGVAVEVTRADAARVLAPDDVATLRDPARFRAAAYALAERASGEAP